MAAVPGYIIGLGFSRGVRGIVLGSDVAVIQEIRYAYLGALALGLIALIYSLRNSSRNYISIGMVVYTVMRMLMNIVRSIEPLIWAIIAVIWIGLGPFAGTIALTLHTIASLGKLYSEAIESIDPGPLEALQSTGANRLQTVIYAVVPQILPPFISFTIYRWDINVRMSTILGLIGGGGIGFLLIQWIRLYQYENAGLAVWLITITVASMDYLSSLIRERFV
jgi:phosphonate transport system permease protein